jgi:hypothetical protein
MPYDPIGLIKIRRGDEIRYLILELETYLSANAAEMLKYSHSESEVRQLLARDGFSNERIDSLLATAELLEGS